MLISVLLIHMLTQNRVSLFLILKFPYKLNSSYLFLFLYGRIVHSLLSLLLIVLQRNFSSFEKRTIKGGEDPLKFRRILCVAMPGQQNQSPLLLNYNERKFELKQRRLQMEIFKSYQNLFMRPENQQISEETRPNEVTEVIYANGDRYKGTLNQNREKQGIGTMWYANCFLRSKYEGQWRKDTWQGKGKLIMTNGRIYSGQFSNGQLQGKGVFVWPDDNRYQGIHIDSRMQVYGTFYYSDGQIYDGQWKNGDRSGRGTLYLGNGRKWIGQFKNDEPNGEGILFRYGAKYKTVYVNGVQVYSVRL